MHLGLLTVKIPMGFGTRTYRSPSTGQKAHFLHLEEGARDDYP